MRSGRVYPMSKRYLICLQIFGSQIQFDAIRNWLGYSISQLSWGWPGLKENFGAT
jgi:hypothetical protein